MVSEATDDYRRARAAAQLRAHTDRQMHEAAALAKQIRDVTDRELRRDLQEQQSNLLDLRDAKREEAPNVSLRYEDAGWFGEA